MGDSSRSFDGLVGWLNDSDGVIETTLGFGGPTGGIKVSGSGDIEEGSLGMGHWYRWNRSGNDSARVGEFCKYWGA